jgi:H+-transporting ATPase
VFYAGVLSIGKLKLGLDTEALKTLTFLVLVFGGQATIYSIRERKRLWSSLPSNWLMASSGADILIASFLAISGIAMAPLPVLVVVGTFLSALVFSFVLDLVKVPVFARLKIT